MKLFLSLAMSVLALSAQAQKADQATAQEINDALDQWHLAAAKADSNAYFGLFTDQGMFLGTAPEETWTVAEFWEFSKPYFRRGKAWDFKAIERDVYQSGDVVWFDETLNTWMDKCRGTGVLIKQGSDWKLAHYSLSILVPNETVEGYLQLLQE